MEYEAALRIKIKEADLETVKKKKLDKVNEMAAE